MNRRPVYILWKYINKRTKEVHFSWKRWRPRDPEFIEILLAPKDGTEEELLRLTERD